jgi:hypothetical protein
MNILVDSKLTVAAALRAVQSLLLTMEHWSCEHCEFAVESFFKNNDSAKHNVNLGSTLTLGEMVRF